MNTLIPFIWIHQFLILVNSLFHVHSHIHSGPPPNHWKVSSSHHTKHSTFYENDISQLVMPGVEKCCWFLYVDFESGNLVVKGCCHFLKTTTTIRITFYIMILYLYYVWFTPYFYFVLFKFFKCGFQTLNWFHDPLMSLSSRFEQLLQTRLGALLLWPTVRALIRLQRHSWCGWL